MKTDGNRIECANPGCGRIAARENPLCETCELEQMLYRRDLRAGPEKESPAVESR
jgi:hypothetical protein